MYQPTWRDGREHGTGRRDAAGRYAAIAARLGEVHGYTVLDFGAYSGYFAARLADEHGAKVVAVDDNPRLADLDLDRVIVVNKRLTPRRIAGLGAFDVGLCLSVLHHLPKWRDYLHVMREHTGILFVETSHPAEVLPKARAHGQAAAIEQAMRDAGGEILTHTPGYDARQMRPLWVLGG